MSTLHLVESRGSCTSQNQRLLLARINGCRHRCSRRPGRLNALKLISASHPETHLPTSRTTAFCRNCLTNQTLVVNMLANYLPDESVSWKPAP